MGDSQGPGHCPKCGKEVWPDAYGPHDCSANPTSGSPPVGPLQELREAIKRERYAGWPEDVVPARRRIDEALESVEEQLAALTRALAVFGIEPPENPGEEWTRITENGPEPAGDTAVEAAEAEAQNVTRLYDKANAELAALQRERDEALAETHVTRGVLAAMRARGSSPSSPTGDA